MNNRQIDFPLVDSSYDNKEILSAISTLLSGQLTMGHQVKQMEQEFSIFLDMPYSIMVNSGSSANLLALSAISNPARKKHLKPGDKVAVPAICWPTSLWPIVQTGLTPVMVDSDPKTLNLSIDSLKAALQKHSIKAVMMVHIMGNSTDMEELLSLVHDNDLILIEDTCESLGSQYNNQYLGSIGDFSTFSFYFSHHMTTIEGGMVCAKTQEDADLLKCMRAHGWSRELSNRTSIEAKYHHIDTRFLFVNMGYNLRPMEIQAAFGLEQLKRLKVMNESRKKNFNNIKMAFEQHTLWENQLIFPESPKGINACWFGFPLLINPVLNVEQKHLTECLLKKGIDTRPIVSGNMAIQPAVKMFHVDLSMGPFEGAQKVHDMGLFIGCHAKLLDKGRIENLVTTVLDAVN